MDKLTKIEMEIERYNMEIERVSLKLERVKMELEKLKIERANKRNAQKQQSQTTKPKAKAKPTAKNINQNKLNYSDLIYSDLSCEGYNYNKTEKQFKPCKNSVVSSAGMCKRCRSGFIEYNGYIKYGFKNITGLGANPINNQQRKHYINWDEPYENNIKNPTIIHFLNIKQFDNYPLRYFPTKKETKTYIPQELNKLEFEKYEEEQNAIFKENPSEYIEKYS